MIDTIADALLTLRARPGRTVGLGLAIVLGVATLVAVGCLSSSASERAHRRLLAARPDIVRISVAPGADESEEVELDGEVVSRIRSVEGVKAVAGVNAYPPVQVSGRPGGGTPHPAVLMGATGDLVASTSSTIDGSAFPEAAGPQQVAIVGRSLADEIGLAPSSTSPTIWIEGVPFTVTGILDDSEYLVSGLDSVVVPDSAARWLRPGVAAEDQVAYVRTAKGGAERLADVLPLWIAPQAPDRWQPEVPQPVTDLAEQISADLRRLALAMASLVVLIGVVGIGNAMMRSVYERTPEIGLRRALGATSSGIVGLVLWEAALIGALAGAVAITGGLAIAALVAGHNEWPLVVDGSAVGLAMPLAIGAGLLGGLLPALTAVRIAPAAAFRRDG